MEPVKLSDLLTCDPKLEIIGIGDPEIVQLTEDSRQVQPGALFFARTGTAHDGAAYVDEALRRGAVAIVTTTYHADVKAIQIITPNVAKLMGEIASRFYREPSNELLLIGVTGTSGKTSVTYWLRYFFEALGLPCGLIGTIEWVGLEAREAPLTTPSSLEIHALLDEMVRAGFAACVMEVSSHSLDQERVAGLHFDAAIFTNLTPEHLDYHKTMEAYGAAKAKLFQLAPLAILNKEDPFAEKIGPIGEIVWYGAGGECFYDGIDLHMFGTSASVDLSAFAPFQIANLLAAISTLCRLGHALDTLIELIPRFPGVPGRMEEVENPLGIRIVVDYAHKPDALEKVLQTLKKQTEGRLLLVFGCGGERDREKRPVMGAIAARNADLTWVTSDNPRGEDPLAIMEEILKGCPDAQREVNRTQAIFAAIENAEPGDTVLIAGRGHEKYQLIGSERIPLHDASCAKAISKKNLNTV